MQAVPEVKPDPDRDGFTTLCRPSLGNCSAWALQHRAALLRLVDANRLRLATTRQGHCADAVAGAAAQQREFSASSRDDDPFTASRHSHCEAGDGGDPVALGQELARHAALWRRASEQADWLVSKMIAVSFLADMPAPARRNLCARNMRNGVTSSTPPSMRRVAAPGAAAARSRSLCLRRDADGRRSRARHVPGTAGCISVLLVRRRTQARVTARRRARIHVQRTPRRQPPVPATSHDESLRAVRRRAARCSPPRRQEAGARRRYGERIGALRADLKTGPRLLPARNDSGERFVQLSLGQPDPC